MASVEFKIAAPDIEDIDRLYVYEASVPGGPYHLIETVDDVGTFPGYIDHVSTDDANSALGWFTIQWETTGGVKTPMSSPVQGSSSTLVGTVVSRVRQRDPSLEQYVVIQEAEAAIQWYFGPDTDPYDTTLTPSYMTLNGLVYLTMARCYIVSQSSSSDDGFSIGVVRMTQSSSTTSDKNVQALIAAANSALGISQSVILQMCSTDRRQLHEVLAP